MNYLAHALLAEPFAHSLIGNLAGDLVKGPLHDELLHPRVRDGVRRHRRVDVLTDGHAGYQALRRRFPAGERRFAGIVLDVLFDYFLSRHWSRFSAWDRHEFIHDVYRTLSVGDTELMPAPLARVAPQWVAADWLHVYETLDGVVAVLERLSIRLASNAARRFRRTASVDLPPMLERVTDDIGTAELEFLTIFGDVQRAINGAASTEQSTIR